MDKGTKKIFAKLTDFEKRVSTLEDKAGIKRQGVNERCSKDTGKDQRIAGGAPRQASVSHSRVSEE